MSNSPRKKPKSKKAIVQRDKLVVKPQPATASPEEPKSLPKKPGIGRGDPKTLGELWERVKRSLYATVDGLCGLPADIVKGAREIVQQAPKYVPELVKSLLVSPRISEAIAKRIEKSAEKSDKQEAVAQSKVVQAGASITAAEAQEKLQAVLASFQAKGLHVDVVDIAGVPTVVAVRPELADVAQAAAELATDGDLDAVAKAAEVFGSAVDSLSDAEQKEKLDLSISQFIKQVSEIPPYPRE